MIQPILACKNPYALAKDFESAGWNIDYLQPPESGDPLVAVSLLDNSILLGITAGYVSECDIPYIGCGVELYLTVPKEEIEAIHRNHQRFHPTDIVMKPWGDHTFKVVIGPFKLMIASHQD